MIIGRKHVLYYNVCGRKYTLEFLYRFFQSPLYVLHVYSIYVHIQVSMSVWYVFVFANKVVSTRITLYSCTSSGLGSCIIQAMQLSVVLILHTYFRLENLLIQSFSLYSRF